jgi:hypothetical protein
VPRVLADHDACELNIVELELGDLLVAKEVEYSNRILGDNNESLAVGRYCKIIGAELSCVVAEVVFELAVDVPDTAAYPVVL